MSASSAAAGKTQRYKKARAKAFLVHAYDLSPPLEDFQKSGHHNPDIQDVSRVVFVVTIK